MYRPESKIIGDEEVKLIAQQLADDATVIHIGRLNVSKDYRDWGWWHVCEEATDKIVKTFGSVWLAIDFAIKNE